MAEISNVVSIVISRKSRSIKRTNFGIALIVGDNGSFADNTVREYEDIDGVGEDFATTDEEYIAAEAYFAQQPCPDKVKIAKLKTPVAMVQTITLSADLISGNIITVDVDGVTVSEEYAVGHDATMTAFAAHIAAQPKVGTAVAAGRVITCTAADAGIPFVFDNEDITDGLTQATVTIVTTVDNVGIKENLSAICRNDDTWYGLVVCDHDPEVVLLAAQWAQSNMKMFGTTSDDTDICDPSSTTDIAYLLKAGNYGRTFCIFNESDGKYMEAALFGACLPFDPGSITWMFKNLQGQTVSNLTETERSAALAKRCNLYTEIGGVDMFEQGKMASVSYIDDLHGQDWLTALMQEKVFGALVNAGKIPYTDTGASVIHTQIGSALETGISKDVLVADPDKFEGKPYYINIPKVSTISANDKTDRLLDDVKWEATQAGAVHKVNIAGLITL